MGFNVQSTSVVVLCVDTVDVLIVLLDCVVGVVEEAALVALLADLLIGELLLETMEASELSEHCHLRYVVQCLSTIIDTICIKKF